MAGARVHAQPQDQELVLQVVWEPKTLEEVADELEGRLERPGVEDALRKLCQGGEVERRRLSGECSVYWRRSGGDSSHGSMEHGMRGRPLRTPVSARRPVHSASARARLSFKSPARVSPSPGHEPLHYVGHGPWAGLIQSAWLERCSD